MYEHLFLIEMSEEC